MKLVCEICKMTLADVNRLGQYMCSKGQERTYGGHMWVRERFHHGAEAGGSEKVR